MGTEYRQTSRDSISTPIAGAGNVSENLELPFLKNIWYAAGWTSEFDAAVPAGRTIIDQPLVLYRGAHGRLIALEDRCAHRWAPLSLGRIEGDDLRCMYHGVKYGADGRCVELPGQTGVIKSLRVRAYPVVEKYLLAWVWMGDPAMADPVLIPDLSMLEEPTWRLYTGRLDYEANYALINDNLLDLSHINFLHEKTLGRSASSGSGTAYKPYIQSGSEAKRVGDRVRVEGWALGSRPEILPKKVPDGDLWWRVDSLVPGINIARQGMYEQGTAEECKGLAPSAERVPVSDTMATHVVTPIAARKTRYFYCMGLRISDAEKEESDAIWQIATRAFSEDLAMIQAQQSTIAVHPGRRMWGIVADRGLTLFRTMMTARLVEERGEEAANA